MSLATGVSRILITIVFGSGLLSLCYQAIWAKQLAAVIGLDRAAVYAVITAFMAGFAVGAFFLDRSLRQSRLDPLLWFAGLEACIGAWGLSSPFFIRILGQGLDQLSGSGTRPAIIFFATTLVLLPSTAAMGATLPVIERIWRNRFNSERPIGFVYGTHTLGATLGILLTTFLLIPRLGLKTSLALAGFSNLALASILYGFFRSTESASNGKPSSHSERCNAAFLAELFLIGFLGLGTQMIWIHVLGQTVDNSVFSYALILAVHLCGSSLGGFLFYRTNSDSLEKHAGKIQLFIPCMFLLTIQLLPFVPEIFSSLASKIHWGPYPSFTAESTVTVLTLFPLTVGIGFLFTQRLHLAKQAPDNLGTPLAWNLLGGALAPFVLVSILPLTGTRPVLIGLGLLVLGLGYRTFQRSLIPGYIVVVVLALMIPGESKLLNLDPQHSKGGEKFIQGMHGVVNVVTHSDGNKQLQINHRFTMGGSAAFRLERRQAHLPLLLSPSKPNRVLFLGVGTGITMGAATHYPDTEVVGVELVPEILSCLTEFKPWNDLSPSQPSIEFHSDDARRAVRKASQEYDVIIGDVFHPARDGVGLLYGKQHFQNVRSALKADGLFCQWLPLHQLDLPGLASIAKVFTKVFPNFSVWLLDLSVDVPVLALIGTKGELKLNVDLITRRLQQPQLAAQLQECQLDSLKNLARGFLTDSLPEVIAQSSAPMNTEDQTFITYHTPKLDPATASFALLETLISDPVVNPSNESQESRFPWLASASWFRARNAYLMGLIAERNQNPESATRHFLEGLQSDASFTLNYAKCISIAARGLKDSPATSRQLLSELTRIAPEQPMAQRLLDRLNPQ